MGQKHRPKGSRKRDSSDESGGEEQLPVGFAYADNFPALPDEDGKGKKAREAAERRQRLQAAGGEWGTGEHNFRTNHVREVNPLNQIKARYKQLSVTVLQDLYDVFQDVSLIDEVLNMTFPMFRDKSSALGQLGKILEKGNLVIKEAPRSVSADAFWTPDRVKAFMRFQRQNDQSYDDYFKLGKDE